MGDGWNIVPLRDVAVPIKRPVEVVPGNSYRTLGVKWWGQGAYERDTIDGSQTAATFLNEVREGDLIINKIWVRHGSVAIVSSQVSGCAGSNEFPTFQLKPDRVLPRWLHWYTKTRDLWGKCAALSQGTSGKNRIRPERFLTVEIPLPPLNEQRRIVAKVEHLAAKIDEAYGLRSHSSLECDQLCRSILRDDRLGPSKPTPMHQLVNWRKPDVDVDPTVTYQFAGVYCFGRGVFTGDSKSGLEFSYKTLTRIQTGEFIYPKLMAWEGALGVVPPDCDGLYVSPEFPVFEIDRERVLPEVLDVYFRSPFVWPKLGGASTGTNVRRRRLNPRDFLNLEFPLPPREVQIELCRVKSHVDTLKGLQASLLKLSVPLAPNGIFGRSRKLWELTKFLACTNSPRGSPRMARG